MTDTLHPRYIAPLIKEALSDTPVVCLLGPRQSGKTTLAKSLDPGRAYLTFDDSSLLSNALNDPTGFILSLPERVTLDEVQRIPALLPALKAAVDEARKPGRFYCRDSSWRSNVNATRTGTYGIRLALTRRCRSRRGTSTRSRLIRAVIFLAAVFGRCSSTIAMKRGAMISTSPVVSASRTAAEAVFATIRAN